MRQLFRQVKLIIFYKNFIFTLNLFFILKRHIRGKIFLILIQSQNISKEYINIIFSKINYLKIKIYNIYIIDFINLHTMIYDIT